MKTHSQRTCVEFILLANKILQCFNKKYYTEMQHAYCRAFWLWRAKQKKIKKFRSQQSPHEQTEKISFQKLSREDEVRERTKPHLTPPELHRDDFVSLKLLKRLPYLWACSLPWVFKAENRASLKDKRLVQCLLSWLSVWFFSFSATLLYCGFVTLEDLLLKY